MFIYYIIIIVMGVTLFWPTVSAAIGTLFTSIIFIGILIITAPFVLLIARKDMRRSDELYEQMKGLDEYSYKYLCLKEQLDRSEEEVAKKTQFVFLFLTLIGVILFIGWIIRIWISLNSF